MSGLASALYHGTVMHHRLRPRRHRLSYRLFSLLLDLDEIPLLARRLRFFSHNRWNLLSFHDCDHGGGEGSPRRHVEAHLARSGIDLRGGPIRLLAMPRILGYVFNPLSVYFCFLPDGNLRATMYEVTNTFRQRHSYLFPVERDAPVPLRQSCTKQLYVSPFIAMDMRYRFRVLPPDDRLAIAIAVDDTDGTLLHAALTAKRVPLTDAALLRSVLLYPLLTLKVMAAIHWEALKLLCKRVPLVRRPPPPADLVTITPLAKARHDAP